MLVLGLLGIVVFSHASEQSKNRPAVKIEIGVPSVPSLIVASEAQDALSFDCTMSAHLTVTVGVLKVEASCTATGANCEQALATAEGCVTAVIKRFSSILK